MKKKFILLAISVILFNLINILIIYSSEQITANVVDHKIVVNDNEIHLSQQIVSIDDITYVPLRTLAEIFGMNVAWNEKLQEISIVRYAGNPNKVNDSNDTTSGQINAEVVDYKISIDGVETKTKENIVSINDRTYVPLRELSELLNMEVKWAEPENTIYINSKPDESLFVFRQNDLYGFMDREGNIKIKPLFKYAGDFSEGLAVVKNENDRYGYINTAGEIVIPCKYIYAMSFSEGLAAVQKREYADNETQYFYDSFSGPLNYINKNDNVIIKEDFQEAKNFIDGLAAVLTMDGKYTYIDKFGNHVTDLAFDDIGNFNDGMAIVEITNVGNRIIDKNINIVFDNKYDNLWLTKDNLIVASKAGKYGVVNFKNEVIIGFNYDWLSGYSEGLFAFRSKEGSGYIDIKGNIVIPPIFVETGSFCGGLAYVSPKENKNEIWLINKAGECVVKIQDPNAIISEYNNGLIKNHEQGVNFYYINLKGEKVIPH